jgi:hypothetical protein
MMETQSSCWDLLHSQECIERNPFDELSIIQKLMQSWSFLKRLRIEKILISAVLNLNSFLWKIENIFLMNECNTYFILPLKVQT